jgi:hypothetical protein
MYPGQDKHFFLIYHEFCMLKLMLTKTGDKGKIVSAW